VIGIVGDCVCCQKNSPLPWDDIVAEKSDHHVNRRGYTPLGGVRDVDDVGIGAVEMDYARMMGIVVWEFDRCLRDDVDLDKLLLTTNSFCSRYKNTYLFYQKHLHVVVQDANGYEIVGDDVAHRTRLRTLALLSLNQLRVHQ
jgi:hypothetical protein